MILGALGLILLAAGSWLIYRGWSDWPARAVLRTSGDTWPLAFSPDSRTLATASPAGITLWDVASGRQRETWKMDGGRSVSVGVFSPDGRTFAAALGHHPQPMTVGLVDVPSGRVKATLPTRHTGVYDLAFTDDGRTLRAFLGDVPDLKEVVHWDVASGQETSRRTLATPTNRSDTAISPDGRMMALVPHGGTVMSLWDLDSDRELFQLSDPSSFLTLGRGVGFSGDGRTLAVGREDGAITLWDLSTRRLQATIKGLGSGYNSGWIRFAPDGRTLVSDGVYLRPTSLIDGLRLGASQALFGRTHRPAPEVVILDVATGKCLSRAPSAIHPFYSPDGRTIATREVDFSVRLRDLPAGSR